MEFGAPEEILWLNKPHIGTDLLREVIKNIRKEILRLGGDVRFEAQVTDFEIQKGQLRALIINGAERLECEAAVLAIGHSARDTFALLKKTVFYVTESFCGRCPHGTSAASDRSVPVRKRAGERFRQQITS